MVTEYGNPKLRLRRFCPIRDTCERVGAVALWVSKMFLHPEAWYCWVSAVFGCQDPCLVAEQPTMLPLTGMGYVLCLEYASAQPESVA